MGGGSVFRHIGHLWAVAVNQLRVDKYLCRVGVMATWPGRSDRYAAMSETAADRYVWQHYSTLCSFVFTDDITFAHNGQECVMQKSRIQSDSAGVSTDVSV